MSIVANQILNNSTPFNTEDFIDLTNKDEVSITFKGDDIDIFVLNEDSTMSFGQYIKGIVSYSGELTLVSSKIKFPSSKNIFIVENTYNENQYFCFYNVDDTVRFRSFDATQGYFSEEKQLTDKFTIKQLVRVYENINFIIEMNGTADVFKFVKDLPNKELKMAFIFTSEIERWNRDDVLPFVQLIETPFNDINERAYNVENMVSDDKGFIYIEGDKVSEEYDSKSLNGNIVKNFDAIYAQMAKVNNYTFNLRAKVKDTNEETSLLLTNNYEVFYDGSNLTIKTDTLKETGVFATDASVPCEVSEQELPNQLETQIVSIPVTLNDYSIISITNIFDDNINTITLYVNGSKLVVKRDLTPINGNYSPDTFIKLNNINNVDYMTQQVYALSEAQVFALQDVFSNGANATNIVKKVTFSYSELNTKIWDNAAEYTIDTPLNDGIIKNVTYKTTLDQEFSMELGGVSYSFDEIDTIEGTGEFKITRQSIPEEYKEGKVTITYEIEPQLHNIEYTKNHKLNSSHTYTFGKYLPINNSIDKSVLRGTVVPYRISPDTNIPRVIFADPKNEIRVGNSTSQVFDRVPFIIEDKYEALDYILWVSLNNFTDQGIPVQYGLIESELMDTHTYSKYETFSSKTYDENEYYFAYHFNELRQNNRVRIKNLFIQDAGEVFIVGNTNKNDYVREITQVRFMDIPKKYKTNMFKVKIDSAQNKDKESFINNIQEVRRISRKVIDEWKPSHTSLLGLEESNAVIMSNLLSDEFAQVLVGFTPNSNVNSYYVRSIESGELDVYTSSGRFDESIDWLAIGRLDSPYVKSGVTKVNNPKKQFKIFFESKFPNADYRVMIFNPNNSKYYVPAKDEDGFIVESSYLVEDEVSWIAVNSNQVVNGTLVWKKGIPEDEQRVSNLDRITEIGINSHKYTLNYTDFGFDNFNSDEYSVILSSDSNVNVWYSNKTLNSVDIRRSYTGEDMKIDYLIVRGSERWYNNITG